LVIRVLKQKMVEYVVAPYFEQSQVSSNFGVLADLVARLPTQSS
jgi:hypothetical protein